MSTVDDETSDAGSPQDFYKTLMQCERARPQALAEFQEDSVKSVLKHAIRHVPYYRDRLGFLLNATGNVRLSRWLDVPTMDRRDVESNFDDLVADEVPEHHGDIITAASSASNGPPVRLKRTRLHETALACASFRHARMFDLDWSRPLVFIRALSVGARRPATNGTIPEKWGPNWLGPEDRGERIRLSVHTPPERQLAVLCEKGPAYLNTSPANAMALAAYVARTGHPRPEILALLSVGEHVSDDLRHECRTHLGCEIIDVFSSSESGVIATQCPDRDTYHMQPELTVLEVLDEDGRPCPPGKTGRVTTTPLYNYAMPLVRYQSEDLVTVGGTCGCGRTAPALSKIHGRANHLFELPDGRRLRPEPSSETLRQYIGFRRWQLAQTGPHTAELRIAALPGSPQLDKTNATAYIASLLGSDVEVSVRENAVLGPTAGGKFAAIIREWSGSAPA